ncbi:MAG: FecR domain-containing protein [Chitinophaga sp.]|uniref:FecR family protein n=1 Tax=Chitinophaga sp. TaxID=1869181 RepID=UPI001B17B343|nr:FecR family protein [Chitinophaga sp.]MBO9730205.1 FecR domain-containing protein [Chitinophaga sp.]
MKTDKEYLTQLVLFELSGKIQEEEKEALHKMILEDQEAAALYARLQATLLPDVASNWGPDEVWEGIRRRKQQNIIRRSIKAAVMLLIAAAAGMFFMTGKKPDKSAPLAFNQSHIQLQLSGGEQVDLSNQQGQVKAGSVALNNHQQQLTFTNTSSRPQYATIKVPAGKDYTVHLPDGSSIQLNAETELHFPLAFNGSAREITVRGEAYMKIAAVASQPFLVHLPGATVQVLGTEFSVNTYDSSKVSVALVQGAVKMNATHDTALLKPGYAAVVIAGKELNTYKFDPDDVLAWRQGLHLFNNASVEEVATLIHRFYGITVKLDKVPDHRSAFTGSIDRNKPVVNFLEGLKFSRYAEYYFDADSTLHLSSWRK